MKAILNAWKSYRLANLQDEADYCGHKIAELSRLSGDQDMIDRLQKRHAKAVRKIERLRR